MNPSDLHVAHGYTLRDIDQMTRAAVIADRSLAADIQTRKDTAWSAIAEHLATCETPPHRQELIRIGWQAIYREARTAFRARGRPDTAWGDCEYTPTPRFAQYWADAHVTPSHEARIVERIAAGQVLDLLTPTYRDAIVALAVHANYRSAADALDISYKALVARIGVARRRLLALWFEGETPPRLRRTDRRVGAYCRQPATCCGKGHEWTPENTLIRKRIVRGKLRKSRVCRACEHDRSVERWRAAGERAA